MGICLYIYMHGQHIQQQCDIWKKMNMSLSESGIYPPNGYSEGIMMIKQRMLGYPNFDEAISN